MPNKRYAKGPSAGAPKTGHRADGLGAKITEKTADWAGVPGKTQGKDRSGGVKKIKQSMKSVGI